MQLLQHFLPDTQHIRLEHWDLNVADAHLQATVASTQTTASCPVCRSLSSRVHSRYQRILQDLTLAQYRLTLQLKVRRFTDVLPVQICNWNTS